MVHTLLPLELYLLNSHRARWTGTEKYKVSVLPLKLFLHAFVIKRQLLL